MAKVQLDSANRVTICSLTEPDRHVGKREAHDDYDFVVATLNERWRVILCPDPAQWILQKRDASRSGRSRWTGRRYFTTRDDLIRACRTLCGQTREEGICALERLPARVREAINS